MRKPVFGQENGLSFLLQLGCEELTVSCEMHWPCSLPLWNSHTGRAALPSCFSSFCQEASPRSLGLSLQTVQNGEYCTSLRGKTCFSVFFFFSFSLDIGLFSLASKDLGNIPLQIFPKSTMSFLKPSPLTEENTVPAGG